VRKLTTFQELEERGFVEQVTNEEHLKKALNDSQVTFYVGFDPTADSLHIGNLLPIMGMAFLQRHGHKPIALVGGATGMIGDPSGKSAERELLTAEVAESNSNAIKKQLERFLDFSGTSAAVMVNNLDWIGRFSYIEWLREVGKHFSVNAMIAKESVKRRLEDRDQGISYTEFSYQLLQAYDFSHLFKEYECTMQAGGSDQWGNITAGIDLIRRQHRAEGFGITFPLVTTSSGEKFGKSAGNAVWLDSERTSPYQFYQYWIQTDDRDVDRLLRFFTFLHPDEISEIVTEHEKEPHRRLGQKRLAEEVTRVVHGQDALDSAIKASKVLFGGSLEGLNDRELIEIFNDVPSSNLEFARLDTGVPLLDLMQESGLFKSKGEARRMIKAGGAYLNNESISDMDLVLTREQLASESVMILRSGKKKYHLIRFQ
jgi:tyrosyl-tRNA synthetase